MTPERTVRYIDLIFNMVDKTVVEEISSKSEFWNSLCMYMIILYN